MILDILKGVNYYVKAIPKIKEFRLFKYFILLTIFLIFYFLFFEIIRQFTLLFEQILPFKRTTYFLDLFYQFSVSATGFMLLLFLSPFFSIISEEVFKQLQGKVYHFSIKQLIKDIFRGIKITIRNVIYHYIFVAILFVLAWLLPKNWIVNTSYSIILTLITSYFYGFTLLDYALENQKYNYYKSVDFVRKNKGIAIGLGLVYYAIINFTTLDFMQNIFDKKFMHLSVSLEAIILFIGVIGASLFVNTKVKSIKN